LPWSQLPARLRWGTFPSLILPIHADSSLVPGVLDHAVQCVVVGMILQQCDLQAAVPLDIRVYHAVYMERSTYMWNVPQRLWGHMEQRSTLR